MKLFTRHRHRLADNTLRIDAREQFPSGIDTCRGSRGSRSTRSLNIAGHTWPLRHRSECRKYRLTISGTSVFRVSCDRETRWRGWHFGAHQDVTGRKWGTADGQWAP